MREIIFYIIWIFNVISEMGRSLLAESPIQTEMLCFVLYIISNKIFFFSFSTVKFGVKIIKILYNVKF